MASQDDDLPLKVWTFQSSSSHGRLFKEHSGQVRPSASTMTTRSRIFRRITGLTEAEGSDHLTYCLPDAHRSHFYSKRFTTTTDWLSCAQDIETDVNRQSHRKNHSTHLTESKPTQPKEQYPKKKPWMKKGEGKCPWPCKF